jgi:hypothetical protein
MSGDRAHEKQALAAYLREVYELCSCYEPPAYGRPYRTPMWEFIRRAKGHPDLENQDALLAVSIIEDCLKSWDDAPQNDILGALFPDSDDPKEELIYTWDRIRWPRDEVARAQADARALPLKPTRCYSSGYGEFISIAGHLQRNVEGPILLPCAKLSEVLDCKPMAISRYRK